MRLKLFLFLAVMALSQQATATEYIYRELIANTLPSPGCTTEAQATDYATKPSVLTRYGKRFCQTQGYGWHVDGIKTGGKLICQTCGNGNGKKCYLEDVELSCKRIRPGSVGLFPGKS